jgi:hypothetical protein
MRRLGLAVLCATLALALSACTCTAEKGAVSRLEAQQDKIATRYLKYVDADPNIAGPSATDDQKKKARDDERALIQSLKDIIASLKKSLGE